MKVDLASGQTIESSFIDNISVYIDEFSHIQTREDLIRVTERVLEENLPNAYTGLYVWDHDLQKLLMLISSGFTEEERLEAEATAMDRHVGKVFKSGIPLIIDDTHDPSSPPWSITSSRSFEIRTRVVLPVKSFDKVVGVFIIAGSKPYQYSEREKSFFSLICKIAGYAFYRIEELVASKKQKEALSDLALIATKMTNSVIIADAKGKIEWVNDAFIAQTGYSQEEAVGKTPGVLLRNEKTPKEIRDALRDAILQGRPIKTEVFNTTKDGFDYTNEIDITPVRDKDGKLIKYISVQKDVTERNQFIQKLKISHTRISSLIQNLQEAILAVDNSGKVIQINQALFQLFNLDPVTSPLVGEDSVWIESVIADNIQFEDSKWNMKTIRENFKPVHDKRVKLKNGKTIEISFIPNTWQSNLMGYFWKFTDISERVNQAKEMVDMNSRFEYITNFSGIGIWEFNMLENKIFWSELCYQIFGHVKTENEDLFEAWKNHIHPEDREFVLQGTYELMNGQRELIEYDYRIFTHSGELRHIRGMTFIVKDGEGRSIRMVGSSVDITAEVNSARQLVQSEEKYREIFANNVAGVFRSSISGKLLDVNKAFLDIYGYTREELDALGTGQLYLRPEDRINYIEKLKQEKRLENYHLFQQSKTGERLEVLLNIQLLEGPDDTVIEGTLIDITHQEELNRKLIENEKKYRDLFENSLDIIQSFDSTGKLTFCNQKWFDSLEYTIKDLEDLRLFDIIAPEYHEHCLDIFQRVLSGETIQNLEVTFVSKNGKRIELNGNVVPIMKDGAMMSTHSFFRDVTIENQQKRQLKSQQIFFENILHNVPAEIKVYDKNFRYIYLNPQAISGIENREMVVGKTDVDLAETGLWPEKIAQIRTDKLREACLTRQKVSYEKTKVTAGQQDKTLLWNVYPVYDENEDPEMLICFGTDVTEQEENRRILAENNSELTKLNHELDRFVYSVSHDLRAPIASVLGLLNLMDKTGLPEDTSSYMEMISSVMTRMDHVIFDILEYSRNSRLDVVAEEVDIKELIQTAFETYQHFAQKKAKIIIQQNADVVFYSDQRRLRSVINNLISNALKYSANGEEEVRIEVSIDINEKELVLKIKDNGEGIKPQYINKIFDMFYRASISATGSGLGLYICKEIIRKLDGDITVESQPAIGTTFTTTIPNQSRNK